MQPYLIFMIFYFFFSFLMIRCIQSRNVISVSGYSVKRIYCKPAWSSRPLVPVVISEEEDERKVISDLKDPYGVWLWPSAFVASEQLYNLKMLGLLKDGFTSIEFGAGAKTNYSTNYY